VHLNKTEILQTASLKIVVVSACSQKLWSFLRVPKLFSQISVEVHEMSFLKNARMCTSIKIGLIHYYYINKSAKGHLEGHRRVVGDVFANGV
jgi:hypothetical protein